MEAAGTPRTARTFAYGVIDNAGSPTDKRSDRLREVVQTNGMDGAAGGEIAPTIAWTAALERLPSYDIAAWGFQRTA